MIYLGNASSQQVRAAMRVGELGQMCTPREGKRPLPGVTWAADNGCYGSGFPGDMPWLAWLRRLALYAPHCLFATAPDVVGDAAATLARSTPWLPSIRRTGYPAAFVTQNGMEHLSVPWDEFDVLFVGGSTEWKLGPASYDLVQEALARGKRVHMGRVNSFKRLLLAQQWGCHSADGTHLAFAPEKRLAEVRAWTRQLASA